MLQNLDPLAYSASNATVVPTSVAPIAAPITTWTEPVILPAAEPDIKEDAEFDKAMVELRKHYANQCANKQMSFALKQRFVEAPMVEYAVSYSLSSLTRRQVAVRRLVENVEKGPGHLSVNRAKQALKEIGSSVGFKNLLAELQSNDARCRWQAAHLVGWLKDAKAIDPLIDVYIVGDDDMRQAIDSILRRHFSNQFCWLAERRITKSPDHASILLSLTH